MQVQTLENMRLHFERFDRFLMWAVVSSLWAQNIKDRCKELKRDPGKLGEEANMVERYLDLEAMNRQTKRRFFQKGREVWATKNRLKQFLYDDTCYMPSALDNRFESLSLKLGYKEKMSDGSTDTRALFPYNAWNKGQALTLQLKARGWINENGHLTREGLEQPKVRYVCEHLPELKIKLERQKTRSIFE